MLYSYVIIVHSSPFQGGKSAYFFAKALLSAKHKINAVFFYHDGVLTALNTLDYPAGEKPINFYWQDLAKQNQLNLVVCKNAALKRGVNSKNILENFNFFTLGQLCSAIEDSDRVITFKS